MSKARLFLASCTALTVCGMLFALRVSNLGPLQAHFATDIDRIGEVVAMGLYGMGIVILVASPLCDLLGMRLLLAIAFGLHLCGIGGFLLAPGTAADPELFWAKATMFLVGLAHGLVEGVINPLIATLYPTDKTHKLNVLHAWWPGGIILGGLCAWSFADLGYSWQLQWCAGLVPTLLYGALILGAKFPPTERVASGVSAGRMVAASLHPLFLLFVALMAVTAATELGTSSWLDEVLEATAGFRGVLLLVYGAALMFVLRFFAGPIARRVTPIGLLTCSSAVAAVGLYALSLAENAPLAVAAATLFFAGVCYFWPTMLGVVSECFPRTGALGMGLLGASGFLGSGWLTGQLGRVYATDGAAAAFRFAAWLPIGLTAVFLVIWAGFRMRGGYRARQLGAGAPRDVLDEELDFGDEQPAP